MNRIVSPNVLLRTLTIGVILALAGACSSGGKEPTDAQQAQKFLNVAVEAQRSGDVKTASQNYEKVLQLQPRNRYALFDLGLLAQRAGNLANAESYYRRALDADPAFRPALFNLAVLRYQAGAAQEAASLYRKIIAQDPNAAGAQLNLGFALLATGDKEGAGKAFSAAIKVDPSLEDRLGKEASGTLEDVQPPAGDKTDTKSP